MGWRGWAIGGLAIALLVPSVVQLTQAAGPVGCVASTRLVQDDAGSGRDAGDAREDAVPLALPPPSNGTQGAYFWGLLDPPLALDGADASDWLSFRLSPGAKTVMLRVVSNYTTAMGAAMYGYRLSVFAEGSSDPLLVATEGQVASFADVSGGAFLAHIERDPSYAGSACAATSTPRAPTPLAQDYGVYVGCDPFCFVTNG